MPVYRLEIDRDTLWVTAHDDQGAIELSSAHIFGEALEEATPIQLTHDIDGEVILRAPAGEWSVAAQSYRS